MLLLLPSASSLYTSDAAHLGACVYSMSNEGEARKIKKNLKNIKPFGKLSQLGVLVAVVVVVIVVLVCGIVVT